MREEFPLGDILTLTTDKLFSEGGLCSLQRMLDYLTRDTIFTHQIPRAGRICAPWVRAQHPHLPKPEDARDVNGENWREWLSEQKARFGESLPLEPLPGDDWRHVNPIEEAEQMFGADRVVVVTP